MASKKDLASKAKQANEQLQGLSEQTKQVADTMLKSGKVVKFKKPNGDYYKLDLVVRDTVMGENKHLVTTETIKRDYKTYLQSVCGVDGMTKYIQNLIEQDAKKNKYEWGEN